MLRVIASGPRTLIQDLGRPGLAHLGVSPSGALDPLMLRRANALVGNSRGAAGLEVLVGGLVLEAAAPVGLSAVGGAGPETAWLDVGERFAVPPATGLLSYVAVRGGVGVAPALGSRSTDLLGGIGPAAVSAGDLLPIGADLGPAETPPEVGLGSHPLALRLWQSPRAEHMPQLLWDTLLTASWVVASDSSRTAVRLEGPVLSGLAEDVPPEGLVRGAVQLPPSGRPVVFLADHPVTGGYPVIGVIASEDLRLLAQVRPGGTFQFIPAA